MEEAIATLDSGAQCCSWNYCGQRLAVGHNDGTISIEDSVHSSSISSFSPAFKWKAHGCGIKNIVWVPPEFGDAIACISANGTLSIWEETQEDSQLLTWKQCIIFEDTNSGILDLQFGLTGANLKMVMAHSDGHVRVFELLDPLELNKWQLQAVFRNLIDSVSSFGKPSCLSASIAWNPCRNESKPSSFVIGYNSDIAQFNSPKIWVFEEAHQRWIPMADLSLPEVNDDRVHAIAWAPNIGRPYEMIAVATCVGITIWHVGLTIDSDGRLPTEKVALLCDHDGEVWQLEWDMSGMTLASTGDDNMVRLWQSDLNGVWHQKTVLECRGER